MFAFSSEHFKCMFSNPNYELARKETDSITALDIPDDRKKMLVKKSRKSILLILSQMWYDRRKYNG